MNLEMHPIKHILDISRNWDNTTILNFSIYKYQPQSILDERTFIDVELKNFSEDYLISLIKSLNEGEELAFHSLVNVGGKSMHIPLIDFSCQPKDILNAKAELRKVIPNFLMSGFNYYDSGRSMHAYGSSLLKPKEWLQFMGRLLLANLPNQLIVIDSRWIGHRVLGGFSSLRLSCNSQQYLKSPTLM